MNTLCEIRDLQKALEKYEQSFEKINGLSLKEGMLLCCIAEAEFNASELATKIDLTCSNCSKVINSVEKKGLIQRMLGTNDKRNMFFSLTEAGKLQLDAIKLNKIEIPAIMLKGIETELN